MKTDWTRWLAERAHYIFWLIWGAGMGAFGAVLLRVVDVGGDALRIYMGIVTVMMGGALGLVASRAMDSYSDNRKVRRKTMTMLMKVNRLYKECVFLKNLLREEEARNGPFPTNGTGLNEETALALIVRMERVQRTASEESPDFDEIVETIEETVLAGHVANQFAFLASYFRIEDWRTKNAEGRRILVGINLGGENAIAMDVSMKTFEEARDHYVARSR